MKKLEKLVLLPQLLLLFACSDTNKDLGPTEPQTPVVTEELTSAEGRIIQLTESEFALCDKVNSLGLDIFNALDGSDVLDDKANYCLAPASIGTTLSMLTHCGSAELAEHIVDFLSIENTIELDNYNKKLIEYLPSTDDFGSVYYANSAWFQPSYSFPEVDIDLLAEKYYACAEAVRFLDPETVNRMNKWCADNTAGNITEYFKREDLSDVIFMCVNAMHFDCDWFHKFDSKKVAKHKFYGEDKDDEIDMMTLKNYFKYAENIDYELVSMDMRRDFEFIALLPKQQSVTAGARSLSMTALKGLLSSCKDEYVSLTLPKFESEFNADYTNTLVELGLNPSFISVSNEGIPNPSQMILNQKVVLSVAESGCKASSITVGAGVILLGNGGLPEPIELTFDRPFIYLVRDKQSGAILVIGRYAQPE